MNNSKTIWIWNHYATNMFFEKGGRHHWFGRHLVKKGYNVKIFCASTIHNSEEEVDTKGRTYFTDFSDGIEYVFIKTPKYTGNGKARIKNMYAFYKELFPVSKEIAAKDGDPDVILASSVHPLTLIAGIKIAKKMGIPCVCEVRDLWPESLIEVGILGRDSLPAKVLCKGEAWIYKRADKLIFTMPGGEDYLKERGLDKKIDLKNVYNINNGIDLIDYRREEAEDTFEDDDLNDDSFFKVMYTGSIRRANCVGDLVDAAVICDQKSDKKIKFVIYGDGDQRAELEEKAEQLGLDNIVFKGRVEKRYIPFILSKGDLNVVTGEDSNLGRYGVSWNKLFEYMASGKPIVANYNIQRYNFVDEYGFGEARRYKDNDQFADAIIKMSELDRAQYDDLCANAKTAAQDFDYENLTDRLEAVLKEAVGVSW